MRDVSPQKAEIPSENEKKKPIASRIKESLASFIRGKTLPIIIGTASVVGGYQELQQGAQNAMENVEDKVSPEWSYFSNIPTNRKAEVLNDFQQVIPSKVERLHFSRYVGKRFPELLLQKSHMEFLKNLAVHFTIQQYQVREVSHHPYHWDKKTGAIHEEKDKKTPLEELKNRRDAIAEITSVFPEGFKPGLDFLPVHEAKEFDDKRFVEGLKRAASVRFEVGSYNKENVFKFLKDTRRQVLFKKIASQNINISEGIGDVPIEKIQTFASLDANVLKNFSGSSIDKKTIELFSDPSLDKEKKEWLEIFSSVELKKNFEVLKESGYSIEEIMLVPASFIRSLLSNNESLKTIMEFTQTVGQDEFGGLNFFCDQTHWSIGKFLDITKPEGVKKFNEVLSSMMKDGEEIDVDKIITKITQAVLGDRLASLTEMYPEGEKGANISDLSQDPAFQLILKLGYNEKAPKDLEGLSYREQTEWIVRTCRNLYQLGLPATPENFSEYYHKGREFRENPSISQMPLFAGRDVALFAHNEMIEDSLKAHTYIGDTVDMKRFGNDITVQGFRRQHPKSLEVFRAAQDLHDVKKIKSAFLEFIKTKSKATVVIDAHGNPHSFSFSEIPQKNENPSNENDKEVSVPELARALIERSKNGHNEPLLFVTLACYNQDFIRNVSQYIDDYNRDSSGHVSMPIMVGTTEYGQYSFGDYSDKYRDRFNDALLSRPKGKPTTLGDIFKIEENTGKNGIHTNISIFVPFTGKDKEGKVKSIPFQIAKTKEEQIKEEIFAKMYEQSVRDGAFADGKTASYYEAVSPEKAKEIRDSIDKPSV